MIKIKSPNFSSRNGHTIKAICIHIAEGSDTSVIEEFTSPKTKKSSHYLVCENGEIIQFVDESLAAWTQGLVKKPTAKVVIDNPDINPNRYCIGIENEGFAINGINETQYGVLSELVKEICSRYNLPMDREHIIYHREIDANKTCPGIVSIDKIIALANPDPVVEEKKTLLMKIIEIYLEIIKLLLNKKGDK